MVSYLHRGTQINELIMNNLPASTANILFTQNHTPEYLHNQKYTCSFNYMKSMSTKSNRSIMFPPFYFKPHVSFQSYRGFQIQKLILLLALEVGLILGSRLTEEARKKIFFPSWWPPVLQEKCLQNCSWLLSSLWFLAVSYFRCLAWILCWVSKAIPTVASKTKDVSKVTLLYTQAKRTGTEWLSFSTITELH